MRPLRAIVAALVGLSWLAAAEAHAEEPRPQSAAAPASSTTAARSSAEVPARPPPLTVESSEMFTSVPPSHLLDVGAGAVMVSMYQRNADASSRTVTFAPGPGLTTWARIVLCPYMQAAVVFSWDSHGVEIDHGALGLGGATIDAGRLTSYRLEAHAMPTLPLGDSVRLFAIMGLGWGRLEIGPMHAVDETGTYVIRGRGASYFDVPLGLGTAVEVIPGWLSIDVAVWSAATFQKDGTAFTAVQALDGAGRPRVVAALPEVPSFFVSSLGLSLVL
ncbi:MAG: hypothetical protein U0271_38025 [Polyangiaceae bacterium]